MFPSFDSLLTSSCVASRKEARDPKMIASRLNLIEESDSPAIAGESAAATRPPLYVPFLVSICLVVFGRTILLALTSTAFV